MNPDLSFLVLAAAAIGLIVNTIAVLGVALKGGRILGRMETSVDILSAEVGMLRERRHEDAQILTRVVTQLTEVERRQETSERRIDNLERERPPS